MESDSKIIEDLREYHKSNTIDFELVIDSDKLQQLYNKDIFKSFKLINQQSMKNMVLFNKDGQLKKYENEIEILEEFYDLRLEFYHRRKNYMLSKMERELVFLENKLKFIVYVNDEKIILRNRPKKEVVKKLIELGFVMEKDMPKV